MAEDMAGGMDKMRDKCEKIVNRINSMSFVNLENQEVHKLIMMREIADGVLNNRVERVTKKDVEKVLSTNISKMVDTCIDIDIILSRISCEGMDEQQKQLLSRMKEIVLSIVNGVKTTNSLQPEPVEVEPVTPQVAANDENVSTGERVAPVGIVVEEFGLPLPSDLQLQEQKASFEYYKNFFGGLKHLLSTKETEFYEEDECLS